MEGTGTPLISTAETTEATKKETLNLEPADDTPFKAALADQDNWKHRSKKMKCRACMFFVIKVTSIIREDYHLIGRCRRHAPTMSGWPVVFELDWCGNHKLDEEKI